MSPFEPVGNGARGADGTGDRPEGPPKNGGDGGGADGGGEPLVPLDEDEGEPDGAGVPSPPPLWRNLLAPAKAKPIWIACPTDDDRGVPEQKSICITTGVTRLPRMSQTATMPPITREAGVNLVATPTANAPALTADVTLVKSA